MQFRSSGLPACPLSCLCVATHPLGARLPAPPVLGDQLHPATSTLPTAGAFSALHPSLCLWMRFHVYLGASSRRGYWLMGDARNTVSRRVGMTARPGRSQARWHTPPDVGRTDIKKPKTGAQFSECLPVLAQHAWKPWVCDPTLNKMGYVAHTCNPSVWEVQKGESGVQGHPWLYSKLDIILGNIRSRL